MKFAEVMETIDKYYESQLLEFRNGDIVNKQGENEGSAKIFSYAALSELDKETTLKLFGEHYHSVKENPDGTDHQVSKFGLFHGTVELRITVFPYSMALCILSRTFATLLSTAGKAFLSKMVSLSRARTLVKTNGTGMQNRK